MCFISYLYYSESDLHGATGVGDEGIENSVEVLFVDGVEFSLFSDFVEEGGVAGAEVGDELGLELGDF